MPELSINKAKYIQGLQNKKQRQLESAFVVEGSKSVAELLASDMVVTLLVATTAWLDANYSLLADARFEIYELLPEKLAKISSLTTTDSVLAVAQIPEIDTKGPDTSGLVLCLDQVRDPGNLGTIIRVADWYGLTQLACGTGTAEWWNPKVIQASMGSFTRVKPYYLDLNELITNTGLPAFGADMAGQPVHQFAWPQRGLLIMGNESNGLSPDMAKALNDKLTIPQFGGAESLNVGIATAVFLDNWRRATAIL